MGTSVRLIGSLLLMAATLLSQGGGGVQFRDFKAPAEAFKPRTSCSGLMALTGYEFSVYAASVVPASESAPEHCRVGLVVQPDVNIEVNLPAQWNGRLYMFGNGGFAGETFDSAGRATNR